MKKLLILLALFASASVFSKTECIVMNDSRYIKVLCNNNEEFSQRYSAVGMETAVEMRIILQLMDNGFIPSKSYSEKSGKTITVMTSNLETEELNSIDFWDAHRQGVDQYFKNQNL